MDEREGRPSPHLAVLWPAMALASAGGLATLAAKLMAGVALGAPDEAAFPDEAACATESTIALALRTVRVRDFANGPGPVPVLLCAPFALHGAAIADLAAGHSLVAALRDAGLRRLFVTDWRSASPPMRFLGIDDYLADLNVVVDHLGPPVDLVGLCQGGWMALMYAARFPGKVRRLALAGAPIDIAAARSGISALAEASPVEAFHDLVALGEGRARGRMLAQFWGSQTPSSDEIGQLLEASAPPGTAAFAPLEARFRAWYGRTVDLPGPYYLEIIEKLYKRNALAAGAFVALGQRIDLGAIRQPLFMLAARDDEVVAPAQLFAAEHLVATPARDICKAIAPCSHVGLFVGRTALTQFWPRIAHWLLAPSLPGRAQARSRGR